jgi:YD repeat-containing protein
VWWQTDQTGLQRTWTYAYDERDRLLSAAATNPPVRGQCNGSGTKLVTETSG